MTPPTSICTGAVYRVGVAGQGTPDIFVKCPLCVTGEDADVVDEDITLLAAPGDSQEDELR